MWPSVDVALFRAGACRALPGGVTPNLLSRRRTRIATLLPPGWKEPECAILLLGCAFRAVEVKMDLDNRTATVEDPDGVGVPASCGRGASVHTDIQW